MLRCFYFTNVSGAADEIKGIINLLSLVHRGGIGGSDVGENPQILTVCFCMSVSLFLAKSDILFPKSERFPNFLTSFTSKKLVKIPPRDLEKVCELTYNLSQNVEF